MRPLEHCTIEQAIDDVVDTDLSRFLAKACGGLLSREEYLVRAIDLPVKMDHNMLKLKLNILAGVRSVAVRGGGGRWRRVQGGRRLCGGRRGGTVALLPLFSDLWWP